MIAPPYRCVVEHDAKMMLAKIANPVGTMREKSETNISRNFFTLFAKRVYKYFMERRRTLYYPLICSVFGPFLRRTRRTRRVAAWHPTAIPAPRTR